MSYRNLIENVKNLTGKSLCDCQISTVIKKYNLSFNPFRSQHEQRDFKNLPLDQQTAIICLVLGLKSTTAKKGKKNEQVICTEHLSI